MFNATPPVAARQRRGGNRRQTLQQDSELPYISPMSNYSYGSRVANLPKPPRLSDTKIKLADGLQAKADEAQKRLTEREEARERERRDRLSMPPPSLPQSTTHSRSQSRSQSRSHSEAPEAPAPRGREASGQVRGSADTNELSNLSGMETRSFASEFVIDPALSGKVRQTHVDQESEPDGEGLHTEAPDQPSEEPPPAEQRTSSRWNLRSTQARQASDDSATEDTTARSRRSGGTALRRSAKVNGASGPKGPTLTPRSGNGHPRSAKHDGKSTGGRRSDEANKENVNGGKGAAGTGDQEEGWVQSAEWGYGFARSTLGDYSGNRASGPPPPEPPTPGSGSGPLWPRRRRPQRPTPPKFRDSPWDWIFWQYLHKIQPGLSMAFNIIMWVLMAVAAYHALTIWKDQLTTGRVGQWDLPTTPPANMEELSQRMLQFQRALTSIDQGVADKFKDTQKELRGFITRFSTDMNALRESSGQTVLEEDFTKFQRKVGELERTIKGISRARDNRRLSDEEINHLVDVVKRHLPDRLSMDLGKDGRLKLPPALKDMIGQYIDRHHSGGSFKTPNWDSFLRANEERLRTYIEDAVGGSDNGVIVGKDQALSSLRNEISRIKDSVHGLKSDMRWEHSSAISSIAAEATAIAKGAWKQAAGAIPEEYRGPSIPDYASSLVGARVWPYLTSPTYAFSPQRKPRMWPVLSLFFPNLREHSVHPGVALRPSVDVGDCWPFPGRNGTLAVKLADYIAPTHVTIEHGPRKRLPDASSAPREIEFWMRVQNDAQRDHLENAIRKKQHLPPNARLPSIIPNETAGHKFHASFVKLAEFVYDANAEERVQSFEVPYELDDRDVRSNVVAFVVKSNYGNEDYTCLYRARVHGYPRERPGIKEETTRNGDGNEEGKKRNGWFGRSR